MYDRNAARSYADSCGIAAGWVFWVLTIAGGIAGGLAGLSMESYQPSGFTAFLVIVGLPIGSISGYVLSRILLAQKYSLLCLVEMEETKKALVGQQRG